VTLTRLALTLALLGVALGGCPQPQRQLDLNSGGDETRNTAKKLFPGQNVTDSLDDPNGDNTDWKEVRVREEGTLNLTVAIDDTRSVGGFISVKDGFGVELDRKPINRSDNLYTFDKIPVYQGEYYVQVFVEKGRSTYTVGATFEPLQQASVLVQPNDGGSKWAGGNGKPPKDPADPKNPPDPKDPKDPKDPALTPPDPKEVVVPPGEVKPPVEEPESNLVELRGTISRTTELESGGTELVISGFGSRDGVTQGMSGTIVGLGQAFRVTQVRATNVTAVTGADTEKLQPYKSVILKVKKAQ
jgi:hypothetical protein